MRLTNKKVVYFETNHDTVLPDCFGDMNLVRRRRFPHFLERKWDLEKDEEYLEKARDPVPRQDKERKPLDEETATFGLSILTMKSLSVNKVNNNTRILVIGASDTGISFIETLLSIKHINFTNITLLSPSGLLSMNVGDDPFFQYKAQSINYSIDELKSLMLDARITVIDGIMTSFDRKTQSVKFINRSQQSYYINYDVLVLTVGFVDKTIKEFTKNKKDTRKMESFTPDLTDLYSLDDPYFYKIFEERSKPNDPMNLITHKKRPQTVITYGRSLN